MAEKYPQRAVGEMLREARRKADLSQEEVAGRVSATRVTVSKWERGQSRVGDDFLEPLASLLGLDAREIRLAADVEQRRDEAERAVQRLDEAERALAKHLGVDGQHARRRASR